MAKMKIKKGDRVAIISGKDAGVESRVLEVIPSKERVIVEGAGRVTRHEKIRMNRRGTQEGGISHKESSLHVSNVALICPTDGPTRAGFRIDAGTGSKARVCKKCGTEL